MATEINLAGAEYNITMQQGSTCEILFTLKDGTTNDPIDITNFDVRMQVRKEYSSTDWMINCTLANGKLVKYAPTFGKFKLILTPADTAYASNSRIKFDKDTPDELAAVYDIEIEDSVGSWGTRKPFYGTFTIKREVTR